jgi:UDP-N-acetylglucosamine 2-epimerase (non-hydrolysing)
MNRRLVDLVSDQLYAPTELSANNLRAENVAGRKIVVTGNTVIDALFTAIGKIDQQLTEKFDASFSSIQGDKKLILITGHRRESFGEGFENICKAIQVVAQRDDVQIVYPLHMNPNVREPVNRLLGNRKNVSIIEPVGYPEFVYLMRRADLILTDSGGVQEEAPSLGKRVLVMRNVTERPEAVETGCVEVVGVCWERITARATCHLDDPGLRIPLRVKNPYGDGNAAEKIVQEVLK